MIPNIKADDYSEGPVEYLTPLLSVQWMEGGRILVVRSNSSLIDSYMVWEEWARTLLNQWPIERTFCVLYDLKIPRSLLTIPVGTRLRHVLRDYAHLYSYSALLVHDRKLRAAINILLRTIRLYPGQHSALFDNEPEALIWLRSSFQMNTVALLDGNGNL